MSGRMRKQSGVRIGPITILVFVIILCIAVLATLAITTARANSASTERQIAFTNDVYANETAAQTMLSFVDAALAGGEESLEESLPSLLAQTQAIAGESTVTMEYSEGVFRTVFETPSGRQLKVELAISGTHYTITRWNTSTNWKEETTGTLWAG